MSNEESAVDKIYQMEEDIKYIKKYLKLIDNNLKLISNKLGKISKEVKDSKKEVEPIQQITATPGTPPPPQKEKSDKLVLGRVKTFGYIVNKNEQPISGVEVNVYDESQDIIKKRKTDQDGYWEVRLPPGKYGVEYIQEGYRPINRVITLNKRMKKFEVK